ncbi:MAG: hypothetical protein ABI564_18520 [Ideonella sp.]
MVPGSASDMHHLNGHVHGSDATGGQAKPASDNAGQTGHGMLKCCSAGFSIAGCFTPVVAARSQVRSPAPLQPVAQVYTGVILDGPERPPKKLPA